MDTARARQYIASVRWKFASTMQAFPHEYTCHEWRPESYDEFKWFVEAVREFGVAKKFFKKEYIYYELDGYEYWTMGSPINITRLINRAKV